MHWRVVAEVQLDVSQVLSTMLAVGLTTPVPKFSPWIVIVPPAVWGWFTMDAPLTVGESYEKPLDLVPTRAETVTVRDFSSVSSSFPPGGEAHMIAESEVQTVVAQRVLTTKEAVGEVSTMP